jgi:hypothetical protein
MKREVLFLGAALIAAVLICVFPLALSLCVAVVTFFCIGYAVYEARGTLQSVERQCFVIAAVAALLGAVVPDLRYGLWFVTGIMLLRFIMQHFFAKDPEETVAEQNVEITSLRSKLSAREEELRAANARIEALNADITAFSARSRKEAEDLSYAEKENYVEEITKMQAMLAQLEQEKNAQDQHTLELEKLLQSQEARTEQERAAHEAELQKLRDERADSDTKLAETRHLLTQASKDKEEIEGLYLESKKKLEEMRKDVDYRADETRTDILETLDILKVFRKSVQNAKAELDIFSPWLNDDVIYKTSFKTDIEKLLKAGVKVKIRYGIGEEGEKKKNQKDDWKQKRSEEIAKDLKQLFQKYRHFSMFRDNAHAKLFICDDEYYVITSFNVLSYHPRKKDTRREIGEMSRNLENLKEYRAMYFSDRDFR